MEARSLLDATGESNTSLRLRLLWVFMAIPRFGLSHQCLVKFSMSTKMMYCVGTKNVFYRDLYKAGVVKAMFSENKMRN